jgi:hypothetical protein
VTTVRCHSSVGSSLSCLVFMSLCVEILNQRAAIITGSQGIVLKHPVSPRIPDSALSLHCLFAGHSTKKETNTPGKGTLHPEHTRCHNS